MALPTFLLVSVLVATCKQIPMYLKAEMNIRDHPANIWNLLPASIRKSPSLPTFRPHLKAHYFQSAYPNP